MRLFVQLFRKVTMSLSSEFLHCLPGPTCQRSLRYRDPLHVRELSLSSCGLSGTLPASFAALPVLTLLYVNNNEFSGSFPAAWTAMDSVIQLMITGSGLTGTLPPRIGAMQSLS